MLRGILLGAALLCVSGGFALADDGHRCKLTPEEKIANASLSFDAFDQKSSLSSTWQALMDRSCPGRAAEAADDYLVNGPPLTPEQKSELLFHEGQALAIMGDYAQASRVIAAAIPPDHGMRGNMDWSTYLIGTWAFLVKDHATLDAAATKLAGEPGEDNRANANVLNGLTQCFDQAYSDAYKKCRPN